MVCTQKTQKYVHNVKQNKDLLHTKIKYHSFFVVMFLKCYIIYIIVVLNSTYNFVNYKYHCYSNNEIKLKHPTFIFMLNNSISFIGNHGYQKLHLC